MKINSQTVRIAFWVLLGVAILASSLALNRPMPPHQDSASTSTAQIGTITAKADAREDVGSTDGIMIVAVIIVLIVIIPILLKRKSWSNGSRKK
jgi:hypothetical protein